MRIRKVTAYALGPLRNETLELADRMTVIIGDNESAKSSWHAAIYAVLRIVSVAVCNVSLAQQVVMGGC